MSQAKVVVIGAGIIGLAVAHHLQRDGHAVTVIDRDPAGDKASFGNAGGIAVTEVVPASAPGVLRKVPGWMLDPLGPLAVRPAHALRLLPWFRRFSSVASTPEGERISRALAAINSQVYDDLLPMLQATGLAGELHREGALTVYESEAAFRHDASEWATKQQHGIEVRPLSGDEARAMEPALGPLVKCGVFTPQWSHINDPRALVDGLREALVARGVAIVQSEVSEVGAGADSVRIDMGTAASVAADRVVIAAGAWSGRLSAKLGDRVLLESERGYNTTIPEPGIALRREVIFAERKFVATPLSCGLRIGGAAEFGGLEATPNYKRSETLARLARLYFPDLSVAGGKPWSGHRPATPDSLPVIGRSPRHRSVFYAFGHGHLGLTQAATTGRLIADLVAERGSAIDLTPYSIARFT